MVTQKWKKIHYRKTKKNQREYENIFEEVYGGYENITPAKYSIKEKREIVQEINPITDLEVEEEYEKLKNLKCKGAIAAAAGVKTGNDIVDKYTLIERLHTKGHTGIDFYTFWYNRDYFKKIDYVKNMLKYYDSRNISQIRKWKYIFNLYFSSISIFRPVMAMEIYCKYSPKIAILDPTMGWGGRLVGACALDLPKYIGIDSNRNLEKPYKGLCAFLQDKTTCEIDVRFQDALDVDYSKIKYDMVFTSPPYYNIEIYRNTREKTKEKWNTEFYRPLFSETWKHMSSPGTYCLNIPEEIYEENCIPILGKAHKKILLKKQKRTKSAADKYKEYIYVWQK
jgi:hypothetical protein